MILTGESVEHWWNDTDRGKPNGTDTNPSECHKSYTDGPGIEFESPRSATNSVSQRRTQMQVFWGREPCGLTSRARLLPSPSLHANYSNNWQLNTTGSPTAPMTVST
jgi:hypothetical protein